MVDTRFASNKLRWLGLVALLACVAARGQSVIVTFAGSGAVPTGAGDGGPATSATMIPLGVAVDASGNIFVADAGGNRIRKVSTNGIVTTVAGSGMSGLFTGGFSGDGGPATSARLNNPSGVAVDTSGNLYIADSFNNRIRKVSADGAITTVAGSGNTGFIVGGGFSGDGGPATAATMNYPAGVAVDAAGNLFISDFLNNRIRKVSASGIITTVAGSSAIPGLPVLIGGFSGDGGPATSAVLDEPYGVALDASGNLFIADSVNNRIRKVSASGIITTVAGSGAFGFVGFAGTGSFSGDGGPATAATMNNPTGVAVDASGNLYIADSMNHRIRKVSASGVITTVAGSGNIGIAGGGFSGDGAPAASAMIHDPSDVAVDGSGNLFIADEGNGRVREVTAGGIINTIAGSSLGYPDGDGGPATSALINNPAGVAVDASGNVFIAESYKVRKVTADGTITTVAGQGARGFSGDGGPATSAALNNVTGVAVDASGNLFIADTGNNRIRQVSPSGIITTVAGNGALTADSPPGGGSFSGDGGAATAAALSRPTGIAVDASGNLFIADQDNNRIRQVSLGGIITTFAGSGTPGLFGIPTYYGGFSGDGGPATSALLSFPSGVAVDASGNVFIMDSLNNRVREVSANGIITTIAGSGAFGFGNCICGSGSFSGDGGSATSATLYPAGVTLDASGNLFIADTFNHRIREVTADGIITTVAGNGSPGFSGDGGPAISAAMNNPYGVAVDASRNLFIADTANNRIREVPINPPGAVQDAARYATSHMVQNKKGGGAPPCFRNGPLCNVPRKALPGLLDRAFQAPYAVIHGGAKRRSLAVSFNYFLESYRGNVTACSQRTLNVLMPLKKKPCASAIAPGSFLHNRSPVRQSVSQNSRPAP
jgi:sugar lactone lactonase YvrE